VVRIHDDSVSGLVLSAISSPAGGDIGMRVGKVPGTKPENRTSDAETRKKEKNGDEENSGE